MPRLPRPGGDKGSWGDVLNAFLQIAHNSDGSLKDTGVIADKYVKPGSGIPEDDLSDDVKTKLNNGGVSDADSSTKGVLQLTGDLGGTADSPTVPGLADKQDSNADLTAIAALSPNNDDILQRKSGEWTNRTPSQLKTDLSLSADDVGLSNVDNTSDADKPVSTATQTALNLKAPLASPTFTGTVSAATIVASSSVSATIGSNGSATIGSLFGHPAFMGVNGAESQPQIIFGMSGLAALLGYSSAIIGIGPGGASGVDVILSRSAAGELTLRQTNAVLGNIVTNLIRKNAGSPEGSVTAPVGAVCQDTTNGIFYVKTVGTGNTGWAAVGGPAVINTQAATDYTLVLADQGKTVEMNHADANTVEVPPNDDVAFPTGTRIDVVQYGAGQTTLVPGSGVTINSASGNLVIAEQYAGVTLYKRDTNEWVAIGALTA